MRAVDGVRAEPELSFARRAEEILAAIARWRAEVGLAEALRLAMERYVEAEPHPELQWLGEILALARRQAMIQQQLDADREALHHGHLSHEQLVSRGHHYEMLRHEACLYNHLLRGFIEACGHHFSREELMSWLTTASQGRGQWARGEVTGAVSEIALHAALQGCPELRGVRYATVAEDLAGFDFVGEWRGQVVTVDAKTGFYRPLLVHKHGHRHLEVSVPREVVREFRVSRHGLQLLRQEVRQVLQI